MRREDEDEVEEEEEAWVDRRAKLARGRGKYWDTGSSLESLL